MLPSLPSSRLGQNFDWQAARRTVFRNPRRMGLLAPYQSLFATLALVRARTGLGLWSPAPTRDRQQEKQRSGVKETQVGNGVAARSTHLWQNHVESKQRPKDQREDGADQA